MEGEKFAEHLNNLKASYIDPSKCCPESTLHQQLSAAAEKEKVSERQQSQFNLGNGKSTYDPMEAAEYLLEREYGDSHVFIEEDLHTLFIPSSFLSGLHLKRHAILDYDIQGDIKRMAYNLQQNEPNSWISKELSVFVQHPETVTISDLDRWILKLKIIDLVVQQGPIISNLPNCQLDLKEVIINCSTLLQQAAPNYPLSKAFLKLTRSVTVGNAQKVTKWLKKMHKSVEHPAVSWLYALKMSSVAGEEAEHWLFHQLQSNIPNSDFVIIHGCDFYIETNQKNQEIDFLMLSAKRKLIVAIEVKSSFNTKAFKQLQTYKDLLDTKLGDILDSDWQYFPVACFFKSNTIPYQIPESFLQHILEGNTNIKDWLKDLCGIFPCKYKGDSNAKTQLQLVLQLLLFVYHIGKGPVVKSQIVRKITKSIETVSTSENIIFYSKDQLPVMWSDDSKYKKVMFVAEYGAGKTMMMRNKTEMLAKAGHKVAFIICTLWTGTGKTLLQELLTNTWQDKKYQGNITVVTSEEIMVSISYIA